LLHILLPVLLILLFSGGVLPVRAATVDNLYSGRVEVADSSRKELSSATRAGLEQVLVKLSGSRAVLQDEEVLVELPRAQRYLQQYQYLHNESGVQFVEISYDPQLVNQLVILARQPLWTANRPPVLVWLVVDEQVGRNYGNNDTHPELISTLEMEFNRRGVPVLFPLYDLQDSLAANVHTLWEMDPLAIRAASGRYETDDILVGRLTGMSDGRWIGDWMYLWGDGSASLSGYGEPLDKFVATGVHLVAEKMAGRYAIAASAGPSTGLYMRVDGLTNYRDYRSTVRFLEEVELIDGAHLAYMRGATAVFRLRAQAEAAQLEPVIALHRNLAITNGASPIALGAIDADLVFQWRQ
jgi:hypothetical protein